MEVNTLAKWGYWIVASVLWGIGITCVLYSAVMLWSKIVTICDDVHVLRVCIEEMQGTLDAIADALVPEEAPEEGEEPPHAAP